MCDTMIDSLNVFFACHGKSRCIDRRDLQAEYDMSYIITYYHNFN